MFLEETGVARVFLIREDLLVPDGWKCRRDRWNRVLVRVLMLVRFSRARKDGSCREMIVSISSIIVPF